MVQLRQGHDRIEELKARVVVVGPEKPEAFARYWNKEQMPFIGLSDPDHRVLRAYGQEFKLLKLGRMPAMVIVDKGGLIRFVHYGSSMADIPSLELTLRELASIA